MLGTLGYQVIRQRGSHVKLKNTIEAGEHNITIPRHPELAKGTLNDSLTKVAIWNNISRDKLIQMLSKG